MNPFSHFQATYLLILNGLPNIILHYYMCYILDYVYNYKNGAGISV